MIMPIIGFNLVLILGYAIGAKIGYSNGLKQRSLLKKVSH